VNILKKQADNTI